MIVYCWFHSVLLLLTAFCCRGRAFEVISPSEFAEKSYVHSPPGYDFIGPQTGFNETGNLYILVDYCNIKETKEELEGKIVLTLYKSGCAWEEVYLALHAKGAAAWIEQFLGIQPGPSFYIGHDGNNGAKTRHLMMPALRIDKNDAVMKKLKAHIGTDTMTTGGQTDIVVRVGGADDEFNPWKEEFRSFKVFVVIRCFIPLLYLLTAFVALKGLFDHAIIYSHNPDYTKGPASKRPSRLNLPNCALALEVLSCSILAYIIYQSGWGSETNVSYPTQGFFWTTLSGTSCCLAVLSGIYWNDISKSIRGGNTWKKHSGKYFMLLVTTAATDAIVGFQFIQYNDPIVVQTITGAYQATIQLLSCAYFVHEQKKFIKTLQRSQSLTSDGENANTPIQQLLEKVSKWLVVTAFCMGMTVFMYLMMGITPIVYIPLGWTLNWSIVLLLRVGKSFASIQVFLPRSTITKRSKRAAEVGGHNENENTAVSAASMNMDQDELTSGKTKAEFEQSSQ